MLLAPLRWTFIVLGALAVVFVISDHLYMVNRTIDGPSLFAIGVGGLFALACGVILMLMTHIGRLKLELRRAAARSEELADHAWERKEAEQRATSLLEAQGDLIMRRDADGRISYVNDAYCSLAGKPRDILLGSTDTLPVQQQGATQVLADEAAPAATKSANDKIVVAVMGVNGRGSALAQASCGSFCEVLLLVPVWRTVDASGGAA